MEKPPEWIAISGLRAPIILRPLLDALQDDGDCSGIITPECQAELDRAIDECPKQRSFAPLLAASSGAKALLVSKIHAILGRAAANLAEGRPFMSASPGYDTDGHLLAILVQTEIRSLKGVH